LIGVFKVLRHALNEVWSGPYSNFSHTVADAVIEIVIRAIGTQTF
jgi:hypothetical protein